jgi:hypothetical protein
MTTVIKRVTPTPQRSAPTTSPQQQVTLSLPDKPKEPDADLNHYTLLIYGREKIGKTTVLSTFPDSIFFSTEPGLKGLRVFEFNAENGGVKNWLIFRQGVELLEKNPGKFKTVIIDTVDRAYDMCLDWVCEERGIEYPGRDDEGKEDFGKSWRAVKMEFLELIHRILQSGRGVCFTSHAREQEFKTRSGDRYTRIFPSMSNQARAVIEAIVDLFFYAEYVRGNDGTTKRVLICQGDETIWAGARPTVTKEFPQFLPLQKDNGYSVIRDAFLGKNQGISATQFLPARATSNTAKEFIVKARTKAATANK